MKRNDTVLIRSTDLLKLDHWEMIKNSYWAFVGTSFDLLKETKNKIQLLNFRTKYRSHYVIINQGRSDEQFWG